jgi:hypothetical protein
MLAADMTFLAGYHRIGYVNEGNEAAQRKNQFNEMQCNALKHELWDQRKRCDARKLRLDVLRFGGGLRPKAAR